MVGKKGNRRRAVRKRKRYGTIPLTLLAGTAFGGLVVVSVLLVLGMAVDANKENTFSLLNDKAVLTTQAVEHQVRSRLDSVANAVAALKPLFETGEVPLDDFDRIRPILSGAIYGNDSIDALVITRPDGFEQGMYRDPGGTLKPLGRFETSNEVQHYIVDRVDATSPPTWGPLTEAEGELFANVTVPLTRDGNLVAYLTAAVPTRELGGMVKNLDEGDNATIFILNGTDEVIAYSDLDTPQFDQLRTRMLPASIAELGDPVLEKLNETPIVPEFDQARRSGVDVRLIEFSRGEPDYLALTITVNDYGPAPWVVGEYVQAASISREITRLRGSSIVGLVCAAIALAAALWLSRRAARPLRALAKRASHIGALEFDQVEPMPRSRVREIDQVAGAFNAMVIGLRAMNTYVPRSLFRKLMRLGLDGAIEAREAELTLIFTDIAGFTTLSENMSATQTAAVLNHHFALLVAAVEEHGGTVDKFLGDGMLAFWGAPDARTDHAEAAVAACLAMAEAIRADNAVARKEGRQQIRIRIGVHTGPVVVGNVGALDRWNYTVVGDAVNVCQRLQFLGRDIAPDDETVILASRETIRRLPPTFVATEIGAQQLRGRASDVDVWRVTAQRPAEAVRVPDGVAGVA